MSESSLWQRVARRYASQPIARSTRYFPYGRLIRPWTIPPRGFAKDAWSHFRKPGADRIRYRQPNGPSPFKERDRGNSPHAAQQGLTPGTLRSESLTEFQAPNGPVMQVE